MELLLTLAIISIIVASCLLHRLEKPFIKRDSDGYITPESYQSHIDIRGNRLTVPSHILVQTRKFDEDLKAIEQLELRVRNHQYTQLD